MEHRPWKCSASGTCFEGVGLPSASRVAAAPPPRDRAARPSPGRPRPWHRPRGDPGSGSSKTTGALIGASPPDPVADDSRRQPDSSGPRRDEIRDSTSDESAPLQTRFPGLRHGPPRCASASLGLAPRGSPGARPSVTHVPGQRCHPCAGLHNGSPSSLQLRSFPGLGYEPWSIAMRVAPSEDLIGGRAFTDPKLPASVPI
jgi:hypothetical protein